MGSERFQLFGLELLCWCVRGELGPQSIEIVFGGPLGGDQRLHPHHFPDGGIAGAVGTVALSTLAGVDGLAVRGKCGQRCGQN